MPRRICKDNNKINHKSILITPTNPQCKMHGETNNKINYKSINWDSSHSEQIKVAKACEHCNKFFGCCREHGKFLD
jgi:hypothetical protein